MVDGANIPDYMRLLDAEALCRIGRHEFSARGVVEGFITGHHRSPYKGLSAEFAEHREYERFSTALVNAALTPLMHAYLSSLDERLGGRARA